MLKERGELPQVTQDNIEEFYYNVRAHGEPHEITKKPTLTIDSPHVLRLYPDRLYLHRGVDIPIYFSASKDVDSGEHVLSISYHSTTTHIRLDSNQNFVGIEKPYWRDEQNWETFEQDKALAILQEEVWLNEESASVLAKIDNFYPDYLGGIHGKLFKVNFKPYGATHTLQNLYHFDRYRSNRFRLLGSRVIEHNVGVVSSELATEVPLPGETRDATLPGSGTYKFPTVIPIDTMMQNALYPPTYHPNHRGYNTIQHNYWGIEKATE